MWKQIKKGQNHETYEKEVKNPVKQSYIQRRKMSEMLTRTGVNADVVSILYFVDSRTKLKISDDANLGITIINNENDLIDLLIERFELHNDFYKNLSDIS